MLTGGGVIEDEDEAPGEFIMRGEREEGGSDDRVDRIA